MQSINFDEGLKSFAINDDENRILRFNPADPDMIIRYHKSMQMIKESKSKLLDDVALASDGSAVDSIGEAAKRLEEMNDVIRAALKLMFNADVYDTIFAGQSPFGIANGKYIFEAFLEALKPVIEKEVKASQNASEKRMKKYLKGYQK